MKLRSGVLTECEVARMLKLETRAELDDFFCKPGNFTTSMNTNSKHNFMQAARLPITSQSRFRRCVTFQALTRRSVARDRVPDRP